MAKGWKYFRWGTCRDCGHDDASLQVPVLDGTEVEVAGRKVIRGMPVPHFRPVCSSCTKKYSLDNLCQTHNIPLKTSGECQMCPTRVEPGKRTSSGR